MAKMIYKKKDGTEINLSTEIVDNVTSTATDKALSANQGKALKRLVDQKAASAVLSTTENLNNVTTPGIYSCGGGNAITNKPSGLDAIGLIVTHNATGNYYTQILTTSTSADTYRRTCLNGTWSAWSQDKYTDTNTWRGIQNNLTSDSTSDSLSAAQGKALKKLVDGKAPSSHTHNYAGSSSAGGAATSANKLNTNAGSAARPVYFANGVPVVGTYTFSASTTDLTAGSSSLTTNEIRFVYE